MDEISDENVTEDWYSSYERLKIVQDILLFLRGLNPVPEEIPEFIIVPISYFGIECELSKYEGTLRERCKKRKRTSRRRREFEAAKARQESS